MSLTHSNFASFNYAFRGIKTAIKNEPNFRFHLTAALIAILGGIYFNFQAFEWLILVLTIFLVLVVELINTSIEAIVNLISPNVHPQAKIAKDVAAAAVLLSAIFSIIVGLFLFFPKMLNL